MTTGENKPMDEDYMKVYRERAAEVIIDFLTDERRNNILIAKRGQIPVKVEISLRFLEAIK